MSVSRYHPLLVSLHWIIAVLLVVALSMGTLVLENIPNDAPEKINALQGHMIFGVTILVLTIIRLIVKISSAKPAKALTGNSLLDKIGIGVHHAFYVFIILMAFF